MVVRPRTADTDGDGRPGRARGGWRWNHEGYRGGRGERTTGGSRSVLRVWGLDQEAHRRPWVPVPPPVSGPHEETRAGRAWGGGRHRGPPHPFSPVAGDLGSHHFSTLTSESSWRAR